MRDRPKPQRVVAGIAAAFLLCTLASWLDQLGRVLAGCRDGFGNPGLTGRLTGEHCVLSDGKPLMELPWQEDLWITVLLALSLACAIAAVLVPRRSVLSHSLAVLTVVVLLYAGLTMGSRGYQRADGELLNHLVPPTLTGGSGPVPAGWELTVSGLRITIPDVGMLPLGTGLAAGLALLALAALLLADRRAIPR
ncbi:hypothetical protein [Amycolatopsis nigrescens]|uniref:hypothetical protein n=1 Tax=Amycolatopsis nigrescens TaxID=381445 RepID=UPI00037ABA79|nr:hypothetical protein [Amycolatopsis nigrescens]